MKIILNGESKEVSEGLSIADLLQEMKTESSYFAVALNREFISKKNYHSTSLKMNDELEVVSPHPGG